MPAYRTVLLLTVVLLCACARTDLGAPCHVQNAAGAEIIPQPGRQYLYLGSSECESFACLATQGSNSGFCSQSCSGPGASCPSGLTCTQLAINQQYLDAMKARLSPDRYAQLFSQLGSTFYCVRSH
ncbi:MAG TPA: adventurous gliding motility lipoprotein CglC [Myxococcales bacterium]|nr:adventurous gliding motility lipoprotein CglC [Myxococcales bacterium]